MRKSHLTHLKHVVVLLLLEHLIAQLQSLELISIVVEVDSRRGLLQEICAFNFNLRIVNSFFELVIPGVSFFEPVDTVALIRLIDLRHDDLLETHWLGLRLAEQVLEVVSDGGFREHDGAELLLL